MAASQEQACAWAFELITKEFKLPLDRLHFYRLYRGRRDPRRVALLALPKDTSPALGEDDNFWAAGPTGPCGPCSEIHFDIGRGRLRQP